MTNLGPSFEKGAEDNKSDAGEIRGSHYIVIGTTQEDKPFTDYEYPRHDAKDSFQIRFGRNEHSSQLLVAEITRAGTNINTAWKGIEALGLPSETLKDMGRKLEKPESITFGGLKFEVGGPASGTLVDRVEFEKPAVQEILKRAADNYEIASFSRVDFITPHLQAPSAQIKPGLWLRGG